MPRRAGIGGLGHGLGVQGNMPGRQAAQVLQPRQQPLCGRETITLAFVDRTRPGRSGRTMWVSGWRRSTGRRWSNRANSSRLPPAPRLSAPCPPPCRFLLEPGEPGDDVRAPCELRTSTSARTTCRLCVGAACCQRTIPPAGPPGGVCAQAQGRNHQKPRLSQQVQQHVHGNWRRPPWCAQDSVHGLVLLQASGLV
jgi:hypothetical protein